MKDISTQKARRSEQRERGGRQDNGGGARAFPARRSSWALRSRPRLVTNSWTGVMMSSLDR